MRRAGYHFGPVALMLTLTLSLFPAKSQGDTAPPRADHMLGEKLAYKIQYGWFTIGRGEVWVDNEFHYPEDRQYLSSDQKHLKVCSSGRTVGLMGALANLDSHFEALVDPKTCNSIYSSRYIKFGKDVDSRFNKFWYSPDSLYYDTYVQHRNSQREGAFSLAEGSIFDALSSYIYLRNVPLKQMSRGDSLLITTFWSNDTYQFGLEYIKKETIKLNGKKINAYKLYLLFPKSGTFPEEKQSYAWISTDGRNIPLKVLAKMSYGTFKCELTTKL